MRQAFWEDDEETVQEAFVQYKAQYRDGAAITFFAVDGNGEYVGFLDAELRTEYIEGAASSPVWYVGGIYIVPEKRNSGVGAYLMATLEAHVREQGYSEIASACELANGPSEAFHKAVGFQEAIRAIHFIKHLS